MEKGFLFALVTLAASSAVTVIACSSDSTPSTFQGEDKPDTGTIDNTFTPDGSVPEGGIVGGGPQCETPKIPDPFTPTWKAPTANNTACSTQQLKDYYTACLKNIDDVAGCLAWRNANATCTSCVESPSDSTGPIQFHSTSTTDRLYYGVNFAGCIAVKQAPDHQGDDGCGAKYNAALECKRQSCTQCLETGGSYGNFVACQGIVAQQGTCASLNADYSSSCAGTSTTAPTKECFPNAGEQAEDFLPRFIAITCGPTTADAGDGGN